MDDILNAFTDYFSVIYLDCILIFSKTLEEHLKHISKCLAPSYNTKYMAT